MRNIKLLFGITILILTSFKSYSQEFTLETKTIIGVFDATGKTKSEIFSSLNKWISLNYNSAKSVVQLNDKEAGNIIVKGINSSVYKNPSKIINPKKKYISEFLNVKFNHTIEINIRDNKYRIIYTLTDIVNDKVLNSAIWDEWNGIIFSMVDFSGLKKEAIDNYNNYIDKLWKKALIGKKKRQKYQSLTKQVYEGMSKDVIANIKLTMLSMEKTVNSTKKNKW